MGIGVAEITSLADDGVRLSAKTLRISGQTACLTVDSLIPVAAPAKVQAGDFLLLGEISHCEPCADGFAITMHIEHAVGSAEMNRLIALNSLGSSVGGARDCRVESLRRKVRHLKEILGRNGDRTLRYPGARRSTGRGAGKHPWDMR